MTLTFATLKGNDDDDFLPGKSWQRLLRHGCGEDVGQRIKSSRPIEVYRAAKL
ncbi:hypothetical protein RDWZM_007212, partial [Blomia tropicalis]